MLAKFVVNCNSCTLKGISERGIRNVVPSVIHRPYVETTGGFYFCQYHKESTLKIKDNAKVIIS